METNQQSFNSAFAKRDIDRWFVRWLDFLAEEDFEFNHCSGVSYRGSDLLSCITHVEKGVNGEEEGDNVSY